MKILQIINNLGSGGAEKLIAEFAPIMQQRGHHVEVLLMQRAGSLYIDILERAGVRVTVLSESSLYTPMHIWRIRQFVRRGGFDIVHVHIFPALYFAGLAAYLGIGKAKLLFTEHNTTNTRMKSGWFGWVDRLIYARYRTVVSITPDVCTNIKHHLKGLKCRHRVVLNGINLTAFEQPLQIGRLELALEGVDEQSQLITMVGRFSHQKDQDTLIRAMAQLPPSAHLLLLGEGPRRGELEALVASLALEHRVHLPGFRPDIPDVLRLSSVGVLSSHWEGFGLAAVECMAAGLPTIVSDVPGLNSVVIGAGLLFPQGDAIELARQLNSLLTDKELYARVSQACKARSGEYSIERMVDGYLEEYAH